MEKSFEFESAAHGNKITYKFNGSRESYRDGFEVAEQMRMRRMNFSEEPLKKEYVADYLMSLAKAMIDTPEYAEIARFFLTYGPDEEKIAFAATVKYKEPKPGKKVKVTYYSMEFQKVSSVKSKEFDRRWEPIRNDQTGNMRSILNLIMPSHVENFTRYVYAKRVYDWVYNEKRPRAKRGAYIETTYPAEFAKFSFDYEVNRQIANAYETCMKALDVYFIRKSFEYTYNNYQQKAMLDKLEAEIQ